MSEERGVRETVREGGGWEKREVEKDGGINGKRGRERTRKGLMERGREGMSRRAEPLETA